MAKEKSYLERLTLDKKLLSGFVFKYITNIRIVVLLVLTIVLLGAISYINLPRRLNPEIKIPIINVVTALPGAGPEDVESLVTIPIENKLRGLSGIDTINSISQSNVSIISLQFFSSVTQEKAKQEVKDAVGSVNDLPEDAQDSSVNALDFEDQPIWAFAIKHQNDDLPSLMRFADELKTKLEDEPKIDRVSISGFETQEITVAVDIAKVNQYGINPLQLSGAVRLAVLSLPAGSVSTGQNNYLLTVDPSVSSINDLRLMRISVDGVSVQLGDIATIAERSKLDQRAAFIADQDSVASRIITMYVYKLQTAKIDESAHIAEKIVDDLVENYENRFSIITIQNTAEMVAEQFTDLFGEFRATMILVFACLLLFLGLRQAIISSFTVPLTFLSAFVFMQILGMSINFLSLFAFLLALGLLIDDTIVVVSAMTMYYKSGKFTPQETGLLVWKDTIVPIWSTTITTIWSFVPLLLSTGIIGEFIKPIPVVITVTMISSTAIAVLITLPFMVVLLKPAVAHRVKVLAKILGFIALFALLFFVTQGNILFPLIAIVYILLTFVFLRTKKSIWKFIQNRTNRFPMVKTTIQKLKLYSNHGVIDVDQFAKKYYRFILRLLASKQARRGVVVAIVSYSIIGFFLVPMGLVKNEFFPKEDAEQLYVNVELPSGTTYERTRIETLALLEDLRKTPETEFVIAEIGRGFDNLGGTSENTGSTNFTLHLPEKSERSKSSIEMAQDLREKYAGYTKGTLQVIEQSGGPPAGADVQIGLYGDDLGKINQYADEIATNLKGLSGITNVNKSIKPGTSALVFEPDLQKLAENNLDIQTVGLWLRLYASGFTLGDVNFTNKSTDKRDIVFRFDGSSASIEGITSLVIPTRQEGGVAQASLGSFKAKANPTVITREDGKRTMTVSAAVTEGVSATEKNQELIKFVESMNFAPGYGWKTGGVNEENAKSIQSILQAMLVSVILILVTMVLQFHSYRQAIIVLLVIPLAVSSVFWMFALTGTPLSFPALIGVLSLFGIVVTNSMFIVDKINLNQKEGMPFSEAIADAGASRLEPIILTKLATVLGLLPITIADPLWRGLGGAIISGLLIASSIMLLFIPVVYYQWFNQAKK